MQKGERSIAVGLFRWALASFGFGSFNFPVASGLEMKTRQVLFALGALLVLSTFAIAEARRLTDAETCSNIRDSGAY